MPDGPTRKCFPGSSTWPTCLNNKPKSEIKDDLLYALANNLIDRDGIIALLNDPSLTQSTKTNIQEIIEENL
ncbi:MAG: hypothetical protein MUC49_15765 [Raineya sp.]|jgi:hypothetical protein|nr:hypothetical protein [Raineya sp.]